MLVAWIFPTSSPSPGRIITPYIVDHMTDLKARVRRLFSREHLPKSRAGRITIGVLLVVGGVLGFLPILGFWMVPLGLAILAIDIPAVRRFTRKVSVATIRWWRKLRHARPKQAGPKQAGPKQAGPKRARAHR